MRHLTKLIFLAAILWGCEEDTPMLPKENDQLLFPTTLPLTALQDFDENGNIYFQVTEPDVSSAYIGLFSAPPEVVDDELANEDQLLWQWIGELGSNQQILLSDGSYLDTITSLNTAYFQCNTNTLYWAAWGWGPKADRVTHSSPKNQVLSTPMSLPALSLSMWNKIGSTPSDTLLIPGEETSLRLTFANTGEATATDAQLTVESSSITSFPVSINLNDLPPGAETTKTITFTVPPNASFGDTLRFRLRTNYNDCLESNATIQLVINALSVCMADVKLIDIRYLPPSILWDPLALPIFYPPDIYYRLLGPGEVQLYRSSTIEDADDDFPNTPVMGDWPDLTPCLNLNIDSTYVISFWDEDLDADDFIGTVSFVPLDYIATQEDTIVIINDEVQMELYLEWE